MRVRRRSFTALSLAAAVLVALTASPAVAADKLGALPQAMRVPSFELRPGTTRLVTDDLRIESTGDIRIGGTLLLAPGAGVHLKAGRDLVIDGTIETAASFPSAEPILHVPGSHVDEYRRAASGTSGGRPPRSRRSVKLATSESGVIDIPARSSPRTAATSRSAFTRGVGSVIDGEDGGSIIVGALLGRNRRVTVHASAELRAGDDGMGYSDRKPERRGRPNPCQDKGQKAGRQLLVARRTDGGKGGTIRLMSDHLKVRTDERQGRSRREWWGTPAARSRRRTADGHGGADMVSIGGRGGRGGAMIEDTDDYSGATLHPGAGGDAGDVFAAAGNGAPGCDGGRTTVRLERPGRAGEERGPAVEPPGKGPRAAASS